MDLEDITVALAAPADITEDPAVPVLADIIIDPRWAAVGIIGPRWADGIVPLTAAAAAACSL